MGLCKCPKKKVTNQFCFEHRVNVCEHCIVADHTKCVVQSYLQWLNDSEYDPKCALCAEPLDTRPCTRLVCYDLFHTSCLEQWGSRHPPHTAPAGFQCPVCRSPVFPAPQLASPVALALKQELATWEWARKATGEPTTVNGSGGDDWVARNGSEGPVNDLHQHSKTDLKLHSNSSIPTHTFSNISSSSANTSNKSYIHNTNATNSNASSSSSSNNNGSNMSGSTATATSSAVSSTYRKASSSDSHTLNLVDESDTDDNKYKRRPALTWFRRWWRSYQPLGGAAGRGSSRRRGVLALVCTLLLAAMLFLLLRGRVGRSAALDSMLDPLNNPNIHVQENE